MSPRPPVRAARLAVVAVMLLTAFVLPVAVSAAPPTPTYAPADVDGSVAEWNLATDYFVGMYNGNGNGEVHGADLYLRYQCNPVIPGQDRTVTLYALVLGFAPYQVRVQAAESSVRLGNNNVLVNDQSGDDGTAPDFRYVGQVGNSALGWEASAILEEGTYNNLNVHTNVWIPGDTGSTQTARVQGGQVNLSILCPPLAVELASFEATARPDDVNVTWTTASETDNIGFNLYRATSPDGERTRLNNEIIPSQVPGGGGASYEWADDVNEAATYYYWLESVDINGATSEYGPVSADWPAAPTAVTVSAFGIARATPYAAFALAATALAGALLVLRSGAVRARR